MKQSSIQYDTDGFLLCPFCFNEIPFISFIKSKNKLVLKVKCLSIKASKQIDLEDYLISHNSSLFKKSFYDWRICTTCSKWIDEYSLDFHKNHIVINEYLNFVCETHSYTLSDYCIKCQLNICKVCLYSHSTHKKIPIEKIDTSIIEQYQKAIDLHIENITKYYDDFNKKVESELDKTSQKASLLNTIKSEIAKAYETNLLMNEHLSELLKCIMITIITISNSPCYQLMKLVKSIQINKIKPYQVEAIIENSYTALKSYLLDNYALSYAKKEKKKEEDIILISMPELHLSFNLAKFMQALYVLHAVRLLKDKSLSQGITALILDENKCKISKVLLRLGDKLARLNIVESNCITFTRMKNTYSKRSKVFVYNQYSNQFVDQFLDPMTNVIYLEVMCSYFSSPNSDGSDKIIEKYLNKVERKEIIFAASFCFISQSECNFKAETEIIMLELDKQFKNNGFQSTFLLDRDEVLYKGESSNSKGMMFVLYYLLKVEMF